eukprot:12187607-Ditylum_brightwellii.AAC.1
MRAFLVTPLGDGGWTGVEIVKQVMFCSTCDVHLYLECYCMFYALPVMDMSMADVEHVAIPRALWL